MTSASAMTTATVEDLFEWTAYETSPNAKTFAAVVTAAEQRGLEADLVPAFFSLFRAHRHWKVGQHLAQQCLRIQNTTLAEYFAREALDISGGDPFPRISLANVMWARRMPNAIFYEASILRVQVRRMRERQRRKLLQGEIAELQVRAHMYLANPSGARPWLRHVKAKKWMTLETAIVLLLGARHRGDHELQLLATGVLARREGAVGQRIVTLMRQTVVRQLIAVLKARR